MQRYELQQHGNTIIACARFRQQFVQDFWKPPKNTIFRLFHSAMEPHFLFCSPWPSLRKEELLFKVTPRPQGDGVDLVGTDRRVQRTVVQEKWFQLRVGVTEFRELVGLVRAESPRLIAMLISLTGFTTGAKKFAKSQGIVLCSIKDGPL